MALAKISHITGTCAPVPGSDIDTDRIIPARFMKCITFDGLGEYLFYDVRKNDDGSSKGHPLDDPKYLGASILLTGVNFGCGSSREHAPQALYRFGFRAIVAESFAEIFFGNCTTLGIPCATATTDDLKMLRELVAANPQLEVRVDVEKCRVFYGKDGANFPVHIPDSAREGLTKGEWDPIAELLEGEAAVAATAAGSGYIANR